MVLNRIGIVQSDGSVYHLYTEHNLYIGAVYLPNNKQYLDDAKTLNIITKALAVRWGLIHTQSKTQSITQEQGKNKKK